MRRTTTPIEQPRSWTVFGFEPADPAALQALASMSLDASKGEWRDTAGHFENIGGLVNAAAPSTILRTPSGDLARLTQEGDGPVMRILSDDEAESLRRRMVTMRYQAASEDSSAEPSQTASVSDSPFTPDEAAHLGSILTQAVPAASLHMLGRMFSPLSSAPVVNLQSTIEALSIARGLLDEVLSGPKAGTHASSDPLVSSATAANSPAAAATPASAAERTPSLTESLRRSAPAPATVKAAASDPPAKEATPAAGSTTAGATKDGDGKSGGVEGALDGLLNKVLDPTAIVGSVMQVGFDQIKSSITGIIAPGNSIGDQIKKAIAEKIFAEVQSQITEIVKSQVGELMGTTATTTAGAGTGTGAGAPSGSPAKVAGPAVPVGFGNPVPGKGAVLVGGGGIARIGDKAVIPKPPDTGPLLEGNPTVLANGYMVSGLGHRALGLATGAVEGLGVSATNPTVVMGAATSLAPGVSATGGSASNPAAGGSGSGSGSGATGTGKGGGAGAGGSAKNPAKPTESSPQTEPSKPAGTEQTPLGGSSRPIRQPAPQVTPTPDPTPKPTVESGPPPTSTGQGPRPEPLPTPTPVPESASGQPGGASQATPTPTPTPTPKPEDGAGSDGKPSELGDLGKDLAQKTAEETSKDLADKNAEEIEKAAKESGQIHDDLKVQESTTNQALGKAEAEIDQLKSAIDDAKQQLEVALHDPRNAQELMESQRAAAEYSEKLAKLEAQLGRTEAEIALKQATKEGVESTLKSVRGDLADIAVSGAKAGVLKLGAKLIGPIFDLIDLHSGLTDAAKQDAAGLAASANKTRGKTVGKLGGSFTGGAVAAGLLGASTGGVGLIAVVVIASVGGGWIGGLMGEDAADEYNEYTGVTDAPAK